MIIADKTIKKGESVQINLEIARLPTRTKIEIPVIVSRSAKSGPTLLLSGGLHGDEINGVEIVRRMIAHDQHIPEVGSTICIPIINIFGFLNFSREVPDGKDINRSFPGNIKGSLASRVAWHIINDVLSQVDYGLDFHTGGSRINNFPQIRAMMDDTKSAELASAFAPPFIINSPYRDKSLRKEASKRGKSILVYEAGESMRLRKNAIDEGVAGARRLMKYLGMTSEAPEPVRKTTLINSSSWIRARNSGIHHALARNGEWLEKGQLIGFITDPFGDFEREIKSPVEGYVVAINNNPVVNRGDALLHIGSIA